jgi:two-component system sensor histidine kinase SenX3
VSKRALFAWLFGANVVVAVAVLALARAVPSLAAAIVATLAVAAFVSAFAARALAPVFDRLTGQVDDARRTLTADALRLEHLGAEAALREQILSSMNEAVLLAENGVVVYANPAARALFGAVDGDALPPVVPVPSGTHAIVADVELHHPARRDVRVAASMLAGDRILAVAQDVTEARRLDAVRRDFVANASHEMKTPVAGILAAAETLQDAVADDPENARRFAQTLVNEARRLASLIADLLSLARLEEPIDEAEGVSFSNVVAEAVADVRARAVERGVNLATDIANDVVVRGRAEDLSLLVRNLLDNAVRYTPGGGAVEVALATDGAAQSRLVVRDTGEGIPQRDLPRIFERFFRVDQARARDTGGTGLGLAIVRHVVETHGGSIDVQSELGAGSTFTVTLPRAR